MKSLKLLIVALILGLGLAILATTPPRPLAETAAADKFSAGRAMQDVARIARAPHPSGSLEHAALRGYLMQRLGAMGLSVRLQEGAFSKEMVDGLNFRSGEGQTAVPLTNIIAVLRGRDATLPAVALMAHYDSVYGSPGAADDGAGVASILETVRALALDGQRKRDVLVVFTDGEETGLSGAKMFFGTAPEARRIGAIINLETRGGGGTATLFQTSAMNGDVARMWSRSVSHPAGTSLGTFIYSVLPNDTDLSVALPHGMAAWNFAFIGRPALYHSPQATAENLDRGSLQQMGEQTLGLSQALARATQLPDRSPDIVFFDVFGLFVAHYAAWWGWAMLVTCALGYSALALRNLDGRAFLGGAVRMLGLIAVAGLALWLLNLVSGAGETANYYDRLAAIPRLQVMAFFASLASALLLMGNRPQEPCGEAGLVLPVFVLAVIGQWIAPAAAYVLAVPLCLCGIVALLRAIAPHRAPRIFAVVVAALVTGYALMLGFVLMQAVGPTMPMACVLPLMMVAPALVPLRPAVPLRSTQVLAALLLLGAIGVALWVRLDAPASTRAVYSDR